MKNYFDFIMYLAFRTVLIYENKRSLTIEQLHNYRIKLCEKHSEYHSQFIDYDDEEFEENLCFFHLSNMNMTMAQENQYFLEFISNNNELFFYKDGIINLRDGVTYEDLNRASFELDSYSDRDDKIICGELIAMHDCVECLDILEAKKIKDFVYKIIDNEKKIERAYQIYTGIELEQNIQKLLAHVKYRLALIGNLKDDKMRCYHRVIDSYGSTDLDSKGQDILLLSECLKKNDKFYNLSSKYIDYILSNKFQRAIFETDTLVYDRLNDAMDAIWSHRKPDVQMEMELIDPEATYLLMEAYMEQAETFDDEFEDDDEIDYDDYDEEDDMNRIEIYLHDKKINMAFYLNYINCVNEFSKKCGINDDLENSKNRLLYLLDGYGDNLYKDENFKNALNNVSMDEIDYKDDFNDFYIISRLFLVDILEGWIDDDMTLKKMLFVSAYYDLTKDKRIKRVINKYKKTEIGEKVTTIIFENDYSKLNSSLSHTPRKLIKKKTDNSHELK